MIRDTATNTRVSGEFGTVEYHANQGRHRPYRHSTIPSDRNAGTVITAQDSAPSAEKRMRKALIENQSRKPAKPKRKRKASVRNIRVIGYSTSQSLYGLEVKIAGTKAETYWLPYSQASIMWRDLTGENFSPNV